MPWHPPPNGLARPSCMGVCSHAGVFAVVLVGACGPPTLIHIAAMLVPVLLPPCTGLVPLVPVLALVGD
jgi:hypothetical protein